MGSPILATHCVAWCLPCCHRCGSLRPSAEAYAAGADMDPALQALVLPDVWARVDESMVEGCIAIRNTCRRGRAALDTLSRPARLDTGRPERLLKAGCSEGSDARALLANSYPDLEDGSRCASRARRPSAARRVSFEGASQKDTEWGNGVGLIVHTRTACSVKRASM